MKTLILITGFLFTIPLFAQVTAPPKKHVLYAKPPPPPPPPRSKAEALQWQAQQKKQKERGKGFKVQDPQFKAFKTADMVAEEVQQKKQELVESSTNKIAESINESSQLQNEKAKESIDHVKIATQEKKSQAVEDLQTKQNSAVSKIQEAKGAKPLQDSTVKAEALKDSASTTLKSAEQMGTQVKPKAQQQVQKAIETEQEAAKMNSAQKAEIKKARDPSSVADNFKGGMHKFKKDCVMHSKPDASSPGAGSVSAGKKLWIDAHNSNWRKAYKKSGEVFIHKDCL